LTVMKRFILIPAVLLFVSLILSINFVWASSTMWTKTYGTGNATAYSMVMTSDGGYAIAGVAAGFFDGQYNINGWLVKTDELGNMQWDQTYGEAGDEQIYSLVETSDGAYVLAGYKTSTYAGPGDMWLIKTDSHGNIPEFPSWIMLPFFLIATIAGIICKKRLTSKRSAR
jgi:hypothetical protein